MPGIEIYIFLVLLVFTINIIPAFMPPTWIILSFLYIHFNLSLLPTVILGVVAATLGRVILALIARQYFTKFLPSRFLNNYSQLGKYLSNHQKLTIPLVLGYAFSPISSNSLFIMAGLSKINLKILAFSFMAGRLFSYTFWITSSHLLSNRLEEIFTRRLTNINTIISALVSIIIVIIIGKINWEKTFKFANKKSTKK